MKHAQQDEKDKKSMISINELSDFMGTIMTSSPRAFCSMVHQLSRKRADTVVQAAFAEMERATARERARIGKSSTGIIQARQPILKEYEKLINNMTKARKHREKKGTIPLVNGKTVWAQ